MALPDVLSRVTNAWASFYDAHRVVSIGVRYLHLAGLLVGGGTALAADRQVLRVRQAPADDLRASLRLLAHSHAVVVPALAVVVLSGLLLTATDTETFLSSPLYWFKMGLVALLVANGGFLVMSERAAQRGGTSAWARLAAASGLSAVLWLVILLVGVLLTVAA